MRKQVLCIAKAEKKTFFQLDLGNPSIDKNEKKKTESDNAQGIISAHNTQFKMIQHRRKGENDKQKTLHSID